MDEEAGRRAGPEADGGGTGSAEEMAGEMGKRAAQEAGVHSP